MAGRGLRTVSVAYKSVNSKDSIKRSKAAKGDKKDVIEEIEKSGFILLGVFGI
jgi:hypothetical protein